MANRECSFTVELMQARGSAHRAADVHLPELRVNTKPAGCSYRWRPAANRGCCYGNTRRGRKKISTGYG
eukprot:1360406-Pyramimonas_sp.AAC.1